MAAIVTRTNVWPLASRMLVAFAAICVHADGLAQVSEWMRSPRSHHPTSGVRALNKTKSGVEMQGENASIEDVLSPIDNVLSRPTKVFNAMSERVRMIQSRLSAAEDEAVQLITKQRAEYEHQLEKQQAMIAEQEAKNAKAIARTEELRKTNKVLYRRASKLAVDNQRVRKSIMQMESNITIAMEAIQNTLNASESLLNNATEMEIMKELDAEDVVMQKKLAHAKRLNSIGMLQFSSVTSLARENRGAPRHRPAPEDKTMPNDAVKGMLDSLTDYTNQKAEHERNLKEMFEARFQAGHEQLQALHDEHKELRKSLEAEKQLEERLNTAVQHLEKTYRNLIHQRQSLAKLFHHMGQDNL